MDDFERELKSSFLEEATQSVADVESCFLALENDPQDKVNLDKIFRLAHNLKGSSKAVGFEDLGVFTHVLESFILKIKSGAVQANERSITVLLEANDMVRTMIEGYKANVDARFDSAHIIHKMEHFESPVAEAIKEPEKQDVAVQDSIAPVVAIDAHKNFREEAAAEAAPVQVLPNKAAVQAATKNTHQDSTLRVSLAKVERLIDFIGEMVILQNVLKEHTSSTSENALAKKTLVQLGKVGKEIQDLAMSLRMVPIKPTFQKMQRIVRDTAVLLNKEIHMQLHGEDTELDKTVLEKISDPLVHLVRNSADHGIESAAIRLEKNKQASGLVQLKAFHSAGRLVIDVQDDGGGLDPQRIRAKAIEKNLIRSDAILTEKEIFRLILLPGFSTKEQVTEISGRGVGMDVVKTNIEELGGEIEIFSELHQGTTFRITLPLTLAIIDSMILQYDTHRFVMPLVHIHETLQPKPEMIQSTSSSGEVLLLRGENLPLVRLGDCFGIRNKLKIHEMTAIIIRSNRNSFGLLVDAIIGQQQVVIKQLTGSLLAIKGVSGTTILGDGRPSLILEPSELVKRKIYRISEGVVA